MGEGARFLGWGGMGGRIFGLGWGGWGSLKFIMGWGGGFF